jgi:hypothetical protein
MKVCTYLRYILYEARSFIACLGRPDTALVTFKTRSEAMYAYKSTEPIFNNRFIKVFWQNDSQVLAELEANGTANTPEGTNDASTELGKTMSLPTGPMGPRGLPVCLFVWQNEFNLK